MHYTVHTLKNGLRVILAPMKESLTTTVLIMVGTGSRYETKENNGISHFLEHIFFKGTEKRPTTLAITEELDAVGGEYNAFTSKDKTGYWAKVGAKHSEVALDVIGDIFLNSKFESKEINRERGAILQEINMYEDMPMRHINDIFEILLYGDQPLGWEIVGPKQNIRTLKRKDFIDYLQSHYKAGNVVLCVAGGFSEKKMLSKIRKEFGALEHGDTPVMLPVREVQKKPAIHISYKKTDQTQMMIGVRAYDMFHKDRYALAVLATLLGGNMSSRLFIEVRERRGLAYNVHTYADAYHDAGYLVTQAGVEHENLTKTIHIILGEYRKISRNSLQPKELKKAKEYLKGKLEMGLESSDEVATFLSDQEILRNEIILPETVMKRVDRVSIKDVQRVAKDIFKSERLNLAIIGPHKNEGELKKLLKL